MTTSVITTAMTIPIVAPIPIYIIPPHKKIKSMMLPDDLWRTIASFSEEPCANVPNSGAQRATSLAFAYKRRRCRLWALSSYVKSCCRVHDDVRLRIRLHAQIERAIGNYLLYNTVHITPEAQKVLGSDWWRKHIQLPVTHVFGKTCCHGLGITVARHTTLMMQGSLPPSVISSCASRACNR